MIGLILNYIHHKKKFYNKKYIQDKNNFKYINAFEINLN